MKAKQEEEFLDILSNYQGIIHKVNLIYFRDEQDKRDNFQEVVCQLWRSFPKLRDRSKIGSWIYAVAINTSITKIRSDSRLRFTSSLPEPPALQPREKQEEETEQRRKYRKVLRAIQSFGEIDRSIMLLYLDDHTYAEIAEIVGISPSNVGVKIHRLRRELQEKFKK